ncbi:MAG: GUN4 domain-containing protein [Cyanobacteria bacterium REEB459]|nr:GUN4 domain-containing protein [Cyanobacteria bacterium REEB459]
MDSDDQPQLPLIERLVAMEAKLEAFIQQGLAERITRLEDLLPLISDIDRYQRLQTLLKTGKLWQADQETLAVMLEVAGTDDWESLTPETAGKFPCGPLRIIDRLWTTYSGGRFGFSIQLRLYQEAGGSLATALGQDLDKLQHLGDRVGWRHQDQSQPLDQATPSLEDPIGCYPRIWWASPYGTKMANYFLVRLFNCEL